MKKIFIFCCILLYLIPTILSLKASLTTPKAVFRVEEFGMIKHYIGVRNPNNFPINITITLPEDLNIYIDTKNFTLEPNQSRKINYTIVAKNNISSHILVTFSSQNESITLPSQIIVYISENSLIIKIILIIMGIIILLLTLYLIFLIYKGVKGGLNQNEENI